MTNGLANCAAARSAPDLTSLRRSMPARQLDLDKLLSLVRTICSGSLHGATARRFSGLLTRGTVDFCG
jgi:hypothetical protein